MLKTGIAISGQNRYLMPMTNEHAENGPGRHGPTISVLLQPEDKILVLPRPKTARQLLAALNLAEETALVAREGELLTPDRQIWPGENILVRKVTSSG